jgi:hypothetical protein
MNDKCTWCQRFFNAQKQKYHVRIYPPYLAWIAGDPAFRKCNELDTTLGCLFNQLTGLLDSSSEIKPSWLGLDCCDADYGRGVRAHYDKRLLDMYMDRENGKRRRLLGSQRIYSALSTHRANNRVIGTLVKFPLI